MIRTIKTVSGQVRPDMGRSGQLHLEGDPIGSAISISSGCRGGDRKRNH